MVILSSASQKEEGAVLARGIPDISSTLVIKLHISCLPTCQHLREREVFSHMLFGSVLSAVDHSCLGSILIFPSRALSLRLYEGLTCSREPLWWAGFTKAFELQRTTANFFQKSCWLN